MARSTRSTAGAAALITAAFTYATFGILIREMANMFGNNAQAAVRLTLALVFLGTYTWLAKRSTRLPRRAIFKAAFLGVAFSTTVLLFTISINATTLANTVFLTYAGSIVTSLVIGTVFLNEKLTRSKLVAIALALGGLAMYSGAIAALSLGVVTGLLAGLADGLSNVTRKTLQGQDRNTVLLYTFGAAALFAAVVTLLSGETIIRTVSFWPIVATLVFAGLLIGLNKLLLFGFQHFDVNIGTVILATELFFAALIGLALFHEVPAPNELIGGIIIFVASVISVVDFQALRRRKLPRSSA